MSFQSIEAAYIEHLIKDSARRCVFVGRFQPFHIGHETIIRQKLADHPVLIMVRNTPINEQNPFSLIDTISMIRAAFTSDDVVVIPIPDIEGIYYGRGVGYNVEELQVTDIVKSISATAIRESINVGSNEWEEYVSPNVADWLLDYYEKAKRPTVESAQPENI